MLIGDSLDAAIVATIAYFDVFAFAPRPGEIHRFLMGRRATRGEVENALDHSPDLSRLLGRMDGFVFLEGKEHLAPRRLRFQKHSDALWPKAKRIARLVESTGLASSGMVTGSLAADNADEHADIDFLFTYPAERTWTSYALVRVLAKLPVYELRNMCPNYVLSDQALEIKPQNLFTAWEVAKSVPLFGFDIYRNMMRANSWVSRYLPNALPDFGPVGFVEPARVKPLEKIASSAAFQLLEKYERERKYSIDRRDVGVDMNDRAKKGSMDRHSPTRSFHVLSELRYRMERLGLGMHPVYPELVAATKVLEVEMSRWGETQLRANAAANGAKRVEPAPTLKIVG